MTYQKFLKEQTKRALKLKKEASAVKLLILELSGKTGADFLLSLNEEMTEENILKYTKAIDEYLILNHPVQHILGYSYFYGYKFNVSKDVLIPRPETEELVGYVLSTYDEMFEGKQVDVIDVGTGSGAIAIALSLEEKNMNVSASDISEEAIIKAKENATLLSSNVKFFVGDMLEPFIKNDYKVDILVSNPPYIPEDEYVEDIVKDNEPNIALFGGKNGMYFYDIILKNASKILKEKSFLAFEHSYSKGKEMKDLALKYFPNSKIEQIKDLSGKDRITIIKNI